MKRFCQGVLAAVMASLGIFAAWWQHGGDGLAASPIPAPSQHQTRAQVPAPTLENKVSNTELAALQAQVTQLTQAVTATQAELARLASQAPATPDPASDDAAADLNSSNQIASTGAPTDENESTAAAVGERFADMASEHGRQQVDSGWGQQIEQGIATRLGQIAAPEQGARVIDTDCRESLCRLRLSSDSIETQSLLPALLASADLQGLELRHSNTGDELITEALLQR
jgi:hypothetical protein